MSTVRAEVFARGVRALAGREAIGIVLSIIAVPIVLRAVGPVGFGVFAAALVISSYAARIATLGLDFYLSRYPAELPEALPRRALAFVALAAGLIATAIVVLAGPLADVVGVPEATGPLRALALFVWASAIVRVPLAKLEHSLAFGAIARIELAALAFYYGVTLTSVLLGAGYWGIVAGTIAQVLATAVAAFALSPILPAWPWRGQEIRSALRFALGAQATIWVWSLRDLVAPIAVAHVLGVREVGIVAAAVLLVSRIGFLRVAVWRVSVPALAKLQDDPTRLRETIRRGTTFQAVVLGAVLLVFAACAPWLIPLVLGTSWSEAADLVALLAVGLLGNAIYTMHSAALLGRGRLLTMTVFHLAHVATLALAATVFVPEWGIRGYGVAELCALWTYAIPHFALRKEIGESIARSAIAVAAAVAVALAASATFGPVGAAVVALVTAMVLPAVSSDVRSVVAEALTLAGLQKHGQPPVKSGAAA